MVRGVTILCDLLRPGVHGEVGGVDRLAAWLHNALKRQIVAASGLPVRLLTSQTSPSLADWVAAQRPSSQADMVWAACFAGLTPSRDAAMAHQLLPLLHDQLCICYEIPPYLADLLSRHAIPAIDLRVHPVRFLDDLIFAVRASDAANQLALRCFAMAESEVLVTAGLREAMCQFIGNAAVPPHTLLVLGQRRFDSTQIMKGSFYDALEHRAEIAAICASYRGLILKPHPLDRDHSLLTTTANIAGNVLGVIEDNIYRLLSLPEISGVLSVSSSVAYEARYFGKTIHTLAPLPIDIAWRDDPLRPNQHVSVNDVVLCVDFWRAMLAPHVAVTEMDGVRLPPKPNRLRLAMDSFWTYNQIDTDRLPGKS